MLLSNDMCPTLHENGGNSARRGQEEETVGDRVDLTGAASTDFSPALGDLAPVPKPCTGHGLTLAD